MSLRWYSVVVDSHDPAALGRWWAETLDYHIVYESDDELAIIPRWMSPDPVPDLETFLRTGQGMVFVPVPEGKTVKNRLHVDLAPHSSQDRDAEIAKLLARGATLADVGQGEVSWTVLADPEGNEFCVLSSRDR
ncbi:MAG TPA: VOC family protein [Propionibacteriaceae bacterium]|nr:VOC family protein [Propionibacteriaceae bacterium]